MDRYQRLADKKQKQSRDDKKQCAKLNEIPDEL